jgi:hypothetical protein
MEAGMRAPYYKSGKKTCDFRFRGGRKLLNKRSIDWGAEIPNTARLRRSGPATFRMNTL